MNLEDIDGELTVIESLLTDQRDLARLTLDDMSAAELRIFESRLHELQREVALAQVRKGA